MAQGDRYLATIIVVEDGGTTCMGDTEFHDEKTGTNAFDKYSFESMELLPELPTKPGSVVRVENINGRQYALLREDGWWAMIDGDHVVYSTHEEMSARKWRPFP